MSNPTARLMLAITCWWLLLMAPLSVALAGVDLDENNRVLSYSEDDRLVWRRRYPAALGPLAGPLTTEDRIWLAVGPQLYALDFQGRVRSRLDLPANVAALDLNGSDVRVTVRYGSLPESYTVSGETLRERVVFPPLETTTGWLERAARHGLTFDPTNPADPAAALRSLDARAQADPTNPFVHAFLALAAQRAQQPRRAAQSVERALDIPAPFFVSVRLARYLDAAGMPGAADRALQQARESWAGLGYDPALPVSRAALRAYGDPLGYLDELLQGGQLVRAEAWMRLLRDTSPRFEGHRAWYDRYTQVLEAQDRAGEAYEWRAFARNLNRGSLYGLGPHALLTLRDAARWATFSILLALGVMYVALSARAWPVQGRDLAPLGGRYRSWLRHPLSRLRRVLPSYWGLGEKLALVALLAALLVALCAWAWSVRTYARANAPVLNMGTYGGAWFYDGLERLGLEANNPEARLVRGLAAQLDGDSGAARRYYGSSPEPCAINNLGVLAAQRGDEVSARELYRAALAASPGLVAPAYNLRLAPGGYEAQFQRTYRPGPRLCYPSDRAVYAAVDGMLSGELSQILSNPWVYLVRFPSGLPRPAQWLWVSLLLVTAALSLLWLLVPRPATARSAARPWLYRLLTLAFPGVAFLDVAWGLVLLLTWSAALAGMAAAEGWVRYPFLLDLPAGSAPAVFTAVLLGCYALNAALVLLVELRLAGRQRQVRPASQVPPGGSGKVRGGGL